jgi:hypothetical protein
MSDIDAHVANCLQAKTTFADQKELQVAGFDFMSLIGILLPVLTQLLGNCFKTPTAEEISARLAKGEADPNVRQAAWVAVKKATQDKLHNATNLRLSQGLCEACRTATDEQRMEFVTGVKNVNEDGLLI